MQISIGEWILLGIWAVSVGALAGQAWAQAHAMRAIQDVFREGLRDVSNSHNRIVERVSRTEALIGQCQCLDGKYQRKCPEDQ